MLRGAVVVVRTATTCAATMWVIRGEEEGCTEAFPVVRPYCLHGEAIAGTKKWGDEGQQGQPGEYGVCIGR